MTAFGPGVTLVSSCVHDNVADAARAAEGRGHTYGLDVPGGDVAGLSPSAQALAVAALAHAEPERLIVAIVPSDADVDRATADVRFFLSAIEGLPDAAAERAVLSLPSHEIDPYRGLAPHLRVTSARARALHAAASGRGRVVIASAAAVLPTLGTPAELLALSYDLEPGLDSSPGDSRGTARHGGIHPRRSRGRTRRVLCARRHLDVFPAGSRRAVPHRVHRRHD